MWPWQIHALFWGELGHVYRGKRALQAEYLFDWGRGMDGLSGSGGGLDKRPHKRNCSIARNGNPAKVQGTFIKRMPSRLQSKMQVACRQCKGDSVPRLEERIEKGIWISVLSDEEKRNAIADPAPERPQCLETCDGNTHPKGFRRELAGST